MKYKKVDYAIEATDYEILALWRENQSRPSPMEWLENSRGQLDTVKQVVCIENEKIRVRPVSRSMTWAVIEGRTVLFYTSTSEMVDWVAINKFVKEELLNGHATRTDAMNAHIVFHAIQDRNKREGRGTDKVQRMTEDE